MLSLDIIVSACLAYTLALFGIAFLAERRAARGRQGWVRSPLVYTLSLSVYCTGWTFYGAVGSAARNGLEYVTIYLGPSLVMFAWWFLLRKLVRIGRAQRVTSIADLISARYGKSATLAVLVTLFAVVASTPYIALQLQSLTASVQVLSDMQGDQSFDANPASIGFWFALGLGLFAILFGTRSIDANEKHFGVVSAIAVEAVVKLAALIAVGLFTVWGLSFGPAELFATLPDTSLLTQDIFSARWATLTFLSATAIICLPRMFQVMVVENADERHLATASWAFPLYLFLISLFVLPIAVAGQALLPEGANPDVYVLTLPLSQGQSALTLLAFLGGFSAATSMVIVATIALSTMISNHIVIPLWLRITAGQPQASGDIRAVVLRARRVSIGLILALGYTYFLLTGGSAALASIGLIAFAGAAQLLPAMMGGIFWRGATRTGALIGLLLGFTTWAYTLFLPSFEGAFLLSASLLAEGPFGLSVLRPQALFGMENDDPLVHSMFWSLLFNITGFVAGSLLSRPRALERLQAAQFVDIFRQPDTGSLIIPRAASAEDLYTLAQRILGADTATQLFAEAARIQGKPTGLPEPDNRLIARIERELTGSVGAASAHAMVSQITRGGQIPVDELIRMADETAQILEYSQELERQSRELAHTAGELRRANARLTELGAQKDAFLSQVSHELRTPMTSIRSYSEILRDTADLDDNQRQRFVTIIHDESQRLTRLLDEILDLSFLESGRVRLDLAPVTLSAALEAAIHATAGLRHGTDVELVTESEVPDIQVMAEFDRLSQVLINLITNAVKYGTNPKPRITVKVSERNDKVSIEVIDNGPGIPVSDREKVFEKFSRLGAASLAGSAGLGLPISREIARNMGGDLTLVPTATGARFRVTLQAAG